jgi:prefoldin subunit 5
LSLSTDLDSAAAEAKTLEKRVEELEQELETLKDQFAALGNEAEELVAQNNALEEANSVLKETIETLVKSRTLELFAAAHSDPAFQAVLSQVGK